MKAKSRTTPELDEPYIRPICVSHDERVMPRELRVVIELQQAELLALTRLTERLNRSSLGELVIESCLARDAVDKLQSALQAAGIAP